MIDFCLLIRRKSSILFHFQFILLFVQLHLFFGFRFKRNRNISKMCTCSSCISFSPNFVLKISLVIFSCNSSKCSGLNPVLSVRGAIGVDPLLMLVLVSFIVAFSSSSFVYFGGTETTPRWERFRSFSRISMNCCENLKQKKNDFLKK